jgi:hypothetical protein
VTSLAETARRLGRLRWVELRLFEIVGGWVASTPEPEVKALLAAQSYHHAWHGRVWAERFPAGYGLDLEEATSPGPGHVGDGLAGWLSEVAVLDGSVARLTGLYRVVLGRLVVGYRYWREEADPVADGPLLRWLGFVLADEVEDWQAGTAALQRLLVTADAVRLSSAIQGQLEASLVAGGWSFDGRSG